MHHILLLLPVLAVLLFFILPVGWALPLFLATLALSLIAYWKALRAQRQRVHSGIEDMVGERAVVEADSPQLLVDYQGEIWSAKADYPVFTGESVIITGVKGLTLQVIPESRVPERPEKPAAQYKKIRRFTQSTRRTQRSQRKTMNQTTD